MRLLAVAGCFLLLLVGAAQAAPQPKALAGVFLGQSQTSVEYRWGAGHLDNGRHYYPSRTTEIAYLNRRVSFIVTQRINATYDGIAIGQRIPLGRCVTYRGNCA